MLATQLLLEGAKGGNLLISLDEHLSQILRNAGTLGLDLKAQIEAGVVPTRVSPLESNELTLMNY